MRVLLIAACITGFLVSISNQLVAQKKTNQIGLVAEAGFPENGDLGFGGFVKGAFGITKSGQLTLQAGVFKFKTDPTLIFENTIFTGSQKTMVRLVPVLVGYKQYFNHFYIEPQTGYGELGGKIDEGGDWIRPSVGAFYWAAGVGYQFNKLDLGVRYQSTHANGGSNAGVWGNEQVGLVGIHVGYFFTLKKK
jgi:hypothetical protein